VRGIKNYELSIKCHSLTPQDCRTARPSDLRPFDLQTFDFTDFRLKEIIESDIELHASVLLLKSLTDIGRDDEVLIHGYLKA